MYHLTANWVHEVLVNDENNALQSRNNITKEDQIKIEQGIKLIQYKITTDTEENY